MSAAYDYCRTVCDGEVDTVGHVNNVAYVEWMQAAALAHSTALGWPAQRYRQLGCGWVVRSHQVEYLQPARAGDEILVRTWVATMRKATSLRCYRIYRASDATLLAKAETLWAFINFTTGQPRRIPRDIADAYPPQGHDEPPPNP